MRHNALPYALEVDTVASPSPSNHEAAVASSSGRRLVFPAFVNVVFNIFDISE